MRTTTRAAARLLASLLLALVCVSSFAQSSSHGAPDPSAASAPALATFDSIVSLDGPWRFQIGDDPQWASPSFDDSSWRTVNLGRSLNLQGIESYSGYAWYRLRYTPSPGSLPRDLLIANDPAGELAVYLNGVPAGHTRGMTDTPVSYWSHPFIVNLTQTAPDGSVTIAIRGWVSGAPSSIGALARVQLGPPAQIADQFELVTSRLWFKYVLSLLLGCLISFCVAFLGAVLYLTQRRHSEYLWLSLLCLSLVMRGVIEICGLVAVFSTPVALILDQWISSIFIAVTLEFILRFSASTRRQSVYALQAFALLIPIASLLHFDQAFGALSIVAQVLFALLTVVMLASAWRRGRREAGVVLLPFLLAATGNFLASLVNYAVGKGLLPAAYAINRFNIGAVEFGLGFFTYQIFLASLIAVILYRFIRVSQEEQRSNAEIAAARSVQALLIPTQLPSNKNFMLESAYLPIHGVGGDFFQVLPLQDESLLLVVGDVSGKGLQAAMNSSTLVGALRNELSHDPATILRHLNRVLLGAVSTPGKVPELDAAPCFATCLCARIYPDGNVTIANAGHLSPYRDGREIELLPSLPLGVIADAEYEQTAFQLNRGDRLVFLSDGVVEAANAEGELFGFERTQQVAHESARYIASTAQRFGQTDDITVVSIYIASRAADHAPAQALQPN
ncbi:MAG TPA: SpoIIE family protein phosphatase [Terracidiphilus sp.]|nr:SpoIIE family protein phosphatase [Terracidiphilus sp.]